MWRIVMVDWIFYKSYVAFVIIRLVIFYTCLFVKKKYHEKTNTFCVAKAF